MLSGGLTPLGLGREIMEMSTAYGRRRSSPSARSVRNIKQPLLRGGLRGALFVHIASFVIPRRAMSRKVMSLRMTRLDTVRA